jgi:hypothetical protein
MMPIDDGADQGSAAEVFLLDMASRATGNILRMRHATHMFKHQITELNNEIYQLHA